MAVKTDYNYEDFENPYNDYLERTDTLPSSQIDSTYGEDLIQNPGQIGENVLDGQSIDNLEIKSWIKSANYKPKTHGFIIDGKLGYIECMQLYVGSGGIVGGALDIPNYTSLNSFHVDSSGNTWWGVPTAGPIVSAPAYILNTGDAVFNSIVINGLSGDLLATAIDNVTGDLLTDIRNARLNTATEQILGDYDFGASGSIYMADDANNGIWLSPTGILGKSGGATTFSIGTDGDAVFAGELSAAFGTFGEIIAGTLRGSLILGDGSTTAVTVGSSINSVGRFIKDVVNDALDTNAGYILEGFDFGTSDFEGGISAGTITWNASTGAITGGSGVVLNRKGLLGANSGTPTFTINANDGSAYFAGTLGSGTLITAPIITGGVITGGEINITGTNPTVGGLLYFRTGTTIKGWMYYQTSTSTVTGNWPTISINASETGGGSIGLFLDASSGYIYLNAAHVLPSDSGIQKFGISAARWDEIWSKRYYIGTGSDYITVISGDLQYNGNEVITGVTNLGVGNHPIGNTLSENISMKRLKAGTNVTMSSDASYITINASGGSSGVTSVSAGTNMSFTTITSSGSVSLASSISGMTIGMTGNMSFNSTARRIVFGTSPAYSYGPKQIKDGDGNLIYVLAQY